jgi:hypothetical protein
MLNFALTKQWSVIQIFLFTLMRSLGTIVDVTVVYRRIQNLAGSIVGLDTVLNDAKADF